MKVYDFFGAPNPKKVRVYLAEKEIDVEYVPVDILAGEHRKPEFRAKNPLCRLPVLELDDGACVPESLAIIEYFEELHPEPVMLGSSPEERLRIRSLERRCELGVLFSVATIVQNTSPFFAKRVNQSPSNVETAKKTLATVLDVLDVEIGGRPFVAGGRPTICDCTLYAALDFGDIMGIGVDFGRWGNLARWYAEFKKRPSARA